MLRIKTKSPNNYELNKAKVATFQLSLNFNATNF